jgi:hypothetical protein
MESLHLYEDQKDLHVCIGKLDGECTSSDCVVGLSLGTLSVLKSIKQIKGKIILVNPLLPRRNIFRWFVQWLNYVTHEGLFLERQKFTKNPIRYSKEIFRCVRLLRTDFSIIFDDPIQNKNITVVHGKNDRYFCDEQAVKFLRSKGIMVIEVESGHNWNEEIEKRIFSIT